MPTDHVNASPDTETPPAPWSAPRFVRQVSFLCGRDTRARSDLRRGLGRPVEQSHQAHRHLVPLLDDDPHPALRQAAYAVASLIAARPARRQDREDSDTTETTETETTDPGASEAGAEAAGPGDAATRPGESEEAGLSGPEAARRYRSDNLGAHLAAGANAGALAPGSAEAELHLYARQSAATIIHRLPSLIRNLTSQGVAIHWPVLLDDLRYWDTRRDVIATRWFDSYFRTLDLPEPSESSETAVDKRETPKEP